MCARTTTAGTYCFYCPLGQGCTSFDFYLECRGRDRGNPRLTAVLPWVLPRATVASRGLPRQGPRASIVHGTATASTTVVPMAHDNIHGTRHGNPQQYRGSSHGIFHEKIHGNPLQPPWHYCTTATKDNGYGNSHVNRMCSTVNLRERYRSVPPVDDSRINSMIFITILCTDTTQYIIRIWGGGGYSMHGNIGVRETNSSN